jgi:serine protease Do
MSQIILLAIIVSMTAFHASAQPSPARPPAVARGLFMAAPLAGGPYLGVGLVEVSDERAAELGMQEVYGIEVGSVQEGSPAGKGGIEPGDVLLRYAGEKVIGVEHFVRLVRETPVGREVEFLVLREGSQIDLAVTIGTRKQARSSLVVCEQGGSDCQVSVPGFRWSFPRLGIDIPRPRITVQSRYLGAELESIDGQLADYFGVEEGLLVRAVEANTPGARAGLQAGDVIVSVDGKAAGSSGDVRNAIRSAPADKEIPIEVMRRRSKKNLAMEPRHPPANQSDKTEARPVRDRLDGRP